MDNKLSQFLAGLRSYFEIDDVLDNPMEIRKMLLMQRFEKSPFSNNGGYFCDYGDYCREVLVKQIEKKLGVKLVSYASKGDLAPAYSRNSCQSWVHIDPEPYTMLLYLTPCEFIPNEGLGYGTTLVKSKTLSLADEKYIDAAEFSRLKEQCGFDIYQKSWDVNEWEIIKACTYKFNRMFLFRGSHYHYKEFFGTTLENSRLSIVFVAKDIL